MTDSVPNKIVLDVAFQEAASHHHAGRLKEAEQLYRSILHEYPAHPDTNHNMGVLAAQVGQCDVGLPFFKVALEGNPDQGQYLLSYVNALVAEKQVQDALKLIQSARQRGMTTPELDVAGKKIEEMIRHIRRGADPTQIELNQLVTFYSEKRFVDLEARAITLSDIYPDSGLVWKMLAAALQSQGKHSLMAKRKAAQFSPSDADVHYNLGNEFYAQGYFREAGQSYRNAIRIDPRHLDSYGNLGVLLNRSGFVSDAVECYRKMLEIQPDLFKAHCILGGLLSNLGQHEEALISCRRALQIQENSPEALCNFGLSLHGLGQLVEAAKALRKALEINPTYVDAYINLGNVTSDQGHLAEARACYNRAIELQPNSALAHYNLASMLHDAREFEQAELCFKRSLEIDPEYTNAYTNLGTTLMELSKCEEALSCYARALSYKPESPQALCNVGSAFHELGRLDESIACYLKALEFDPHFADAHGNLGGIYMQLGKLETAEAYLNTALELVPKDARVLTTALVYLPYQENSPRFAQLEEAYAQRATLSTNVRISFCIAYGKAMENIGQYDRSFLAYEEGNRLHFNDNPFDEVAEVHAINHAVSLMTKEKFEQFAVPGFPVNAAQEKRIPVFIVGMQRSGSTLVEQILSSHPEVHGAGELMILGALAGKADRLIQQSSDAAATLLALRQLGNEYLDEVWKNGPQARYVIDKMPHNFYFVGLIHLMFPGAKIIHTIRDPIDTCFSGYALRFGAANEFTYDLETLGRYYVRYEKLMLHWRNALPRDRILEIHYEENVANPEQEARRMLTYLGLPWNPSCLDFHKNMRTVRTASVTQVRKPMYSTSVARWKHFEKHLGPLINVLRANRSEE